MTVRDLARRVDFYPRPPRGGRPALQRQYMAASKFLSTPSARRATHRPQRIPRRGDISIHALREEGDSAPISIDSTIRAFLSTPSARRATTAITKWRKGDYISIHALREEGDQRTPQGMAIRQISIHALREEGDPIFEIIPADIYNFYPRPPRGGRLGGVCVHNGI